jgi:hypothetical protein
MRTGEQARIPAIVTPQDGFAQRTRRSFAFGSSNMNHGWSFLVAVNKSDLNPTQVDFHVFNGLGSTG